MKAGSNTAAFRQDVGCLNINLGACRMCLLFLIDVIVAILVLGTILFISKL